MQQITMRILEIYSGQGLPLSNVRKPRSLLEGGVVNKMSKQGQTDGRQLSFGQDNLEGLKPPISGDPSF